jgi:hypothetical protein
MGPDLIVEFVNTYLKAITPLVDALPSNAPCGDAVIDNKINLAGANVDPLSACTPRCVCPVFRHIRRSIG